MSGRYQVVRSIAKGGMAEVFLARMTGEAGFAKTVALKRLPASLVDDAEVIKMLMDEARLAARLNHPQVVQVFDFGHDDEGYYIAMEYVEGPDLNTVLKYFRSTAERPPEGALLSAMIQALRGLDYAHRLTDESGKLLGVVHRDVSPSNVLVTAEGVAKVSDFGIAKAQGRATETRVGSIKGKLPYMSPEQARGRPVDARTDVLSAGLVVWECVVGRRCYDATADNDILRQAAYAEHMTFAQAGVTVDRELQDIVERSLRHDPLERFQTAGEMAQALETYHRRAHPQFRPEELGSVVKRVMGTARSASGAFVVAPAPPPSLGVEATSRHADRDPDPDPEASGPFKARFFSAGRTKLPEGDPATEWGLGGVVAESPEPTVNSPPRGPHADPEPSGSVSRDAIGTGGKGKRLRDPEPSGVRRPGARPIPNFKSGAEASAGDDGALGGPTQRQIETPVAAAAPSSKPAAKASGAGDEPKLEGQGTGFFTAVLMVMLTVIIGGGVFVGISYFEKKSEGPGTEADLNRKPPPSAPIHPKGAPTGTNAVAAKEAPPGLKTFPEPDAGQAPPDTTVVGGANPNVNEEPSHEDSHSGKKGKHHKGDKGDKVAAAGEYGTLDIGCTPGCDVFIDGAMVGASPVKGLSLPAGRHAIKVKSPALGTEKKVEVTVGANDHVIRTFSLP